MNEDFNAKNFLKTITNQPGVYCMHDDNGVVIYVGKAKDLKKRLSSYFVNNITNNRTKNLINNIQNISVTITNNETEALLLEHNYIKFYRPRYNVRFRDDKSYPFIFLSNDPYPRLAIHFGEKKAKGEYFGPFPNNHAVRQILTLLQKTFPIRQCKDNIYYNRSRPCLQYQIKRCLGPCISGLVNEQEYSNYTECIRLFLLGKNHLLLNKLISRMEQASQSLHFEEASQIHSQILAVQYITEKQCVSKKEEDNVDIINISYAAGIVCLCIFFIRQGRIIGNQNYFQKITNHSKLFKVVQTLILQSYLDSNKLHTPSRKILLDCNFLEKELLIESIKKLTGYTIQIKSNLRSDQSSYLKLVRANAEVALTSKLIQKPMIRERLIALSKVLNLPKIDRIECIDISHIMGEQMVASCVVFSNDGPKYSEYRRYNITDIIPGDDCAAINQVLIRRYRKFLDPKKAPDVILIDGGKEQLATAKRAFLELDVNWNKTYPLLLGIAKDKDRKEGLETLFLEPEGRKFFLSPDSPALHIIQHIRNVSHRYAITEHRKKYAKSKNISILENIKGIGPKRRKKILKYTGSLQSLRNATTEEIAKIPGISNVIAEKVLHSLKIRTLKQY